MYQCDDSSHLNSRNYRKVNSSLEGVPEWVPEALKTHCSFHGSISRIAATRKLIRKGGNCYLTRYSSYHNSCVVSLLRTSEDGELLQHLQLNIITCNNELKYDIAGTDNGFAEFSELLEFYEKNQLTDTIECLGECLKPGIDALHIHELQKARQSSLELVSSWKIFNHSSYQVMNCSLFF